MESFQQYLHQIWCGLDSIRGSVDQHETLWILALPITGIVAWLLGRFREGWGRFASILLFVIVTVGAAVLLVLPSPDYCAYTMPISTSAAVPVREASFGFGEARPKGFTLDIPGFMRRVQGGGTEVVFAYERDNRTTLKIWSDPRPSSGAFARLVERYNDIEDRAQKEMPPRRRLETDKRPTKNAPYFILSWRTSEDMDIYACWRVKTIDGKRYVGGFEITTPAAGNPFIGENYTRMAKSFLADDL